MARLEHMNSVLVYLPLIFCLNILHHILYNMILKSNKFRIFCCSIEKTIFWMRTFISWWLLISWPVFSIFRQFFIRSPRFSVLCKCFLQKVFEFPQSFFTAMLCKTYNIKMLCLPFDIQPLYRICLLYNALQSSSHLFLYLISLIIGLLYLLFGIIGSKIIN